jgi:hypothetical protein
MEHFGFLFIKTDILKLKKRKKNRTFKKNVDGRSKNSLDNLKFRKRLTKKQGVMAFGFRKTAKAAIKPGG